MKSIYKELMIIVAAFAICFFVCDVAFASESNKKMTNNEISNFGMTISLPSDWYFNTPKAIDPEFMKVTENKERKLKKYLDDNKICYNIISKDLETEIDVIAKNNTQTKLAFDFNTLTDEQLIEQAKVLVNEGAKKLEETTDYQNYSLEHINQCKYMHFTGVVEGASFEQYTTCINGVNVTVLLRHYDGAVSEKEKELLGEVLDSFSVQEVHEKNFKKTLFQELTPAVLILVVFIGLGVCLLINYIRNRKSS